MRYWLRLMQGAAKPCIKQLSLMMGLMFVFLVSLKLLSACNAESVTLSLLVPQPEAQFWRSPIEEFENKYPNIRINLKNFDKTQIQKPENTNQLRTIYLSALKKDSSAIDLIYLDSIWVSEFAEAGLLQELSNDFSIEALNDEFLKEDVEAGIYQKKLYRIPFRTDVGILYYRQDLLEQERFSPPETFEQLEQISQTLQAQQKVRWGYLWQGRHSEALTAMFIEVIKGYGGFWIEDEKVGLDGQEAIEAVEFLRNTIVEKISPPDITSHEEQRTRYLFRAGQAAFMRNWHNVWVDVHGAESNVSGKIAIKPMVHAPGKRSAACRGGWGFAIAKGAKHNKEAIQAIKFFTSAALQRQFTLTYGSVPSRRNLLLEPSIVAKYSHYPELLNTIENYSVMRPRLPQYVQASCILQKYLSAAFNPDAKGYPSPQQAMTAAATETRQLLITGKSNCNSTTANKP